MNPRGRTAQYNCSNTQLCSRRRGQGGKYSCYPGFQWLFLFLLQHSYWGKDCLDIHFVTESEKWVLCGNDQRVIEFSEFSQLEETVLTIQFAYKQGKKFKSIEVTSKVESFFLKFILQVSNPCFAGQNNAVFHVQHLPSTRRCPIFPISF